VSPIRLTFAYRSVKRTVHCRADAPNQGCSTRQGWGQKGVGDGRITALRPTGKSLLKVLDASHGRVGARMPVAVGDSFFRPVLQIQFHPGLDFGRGLFLEEACSLRLRSVWKDTRRCTLAGLFP
jgi:hypothetical protein